ncbi:MAG: phage Gp37/Gp68 family protein, partial [Helicobacter sp.]|nr:phage Gp37/Gp68 family protein [Helicobacter sp.]
MHKIQWTDKTWNVITGCTQISPACDNCYAKAMTKRLQGIAESNFRNLYPKDSCLTFTSKGEISGIH